MEYPLEWDRPLSACIHGRNQAKESGYRYAPLSEAEWWVGEWTRRTLEGYADEDAVRRYSWWAERLKALQEIKSLE